MDSSEALTDTPPTKPQELKVKIPRKQAFYLTPDLEEEIEGTAHLVKFVEGNILIDGSCIGPITSVSGLKSLFRDIHPVGWHQSFNDEEMVLTEVLTDSQRSDLKEVGECDLGSGDKLIHMGKLLMFKESHGQRFRNFPLRNCIHLNNYQKVPDNEVIQSPLKLSYKFEELGLPPPANFISLGSIARKLNLELAEEGYFPLNLLDDKTLAYFAASVKGPMFRSFVIGDSPDTIDSDVRQCYTHILEYTPSASPNYCNYIWDTDYHPEAAFCSCIIWINLDVLQIMPLGVRLMDLYWKDEEILPRSKRYTVYPWGKFKKVWVSFPTLWYLVEKLKLVLGKDLGIIEGIWVIPHCGLVFPWREWSRVVKRAVAGCPELRFLGHLGVTGGIIPKKVKVGEFHYQVIHEALDTENPLLLAHLFDMTRILVLLAAAQAKNIKGIASDGLVSEGGVPDEIGPFRIGCINYGPFPVKNNPLELYYQFDPIRHDKITSLDKKEGLFWRDMAEASRNRETLKYQVESHLTYKEGWEDPESIGSPLRREWEYTPSLGDMIPQTPFEVVGDTLGNEIKGKASHTSQAHRRIPYLREPIVGTAKYG